MAGSKPFSCRQNQRMSMAGSKPHHQQKEELGYITLSLSLAINYQLGFWLTLS